MTTNNNNIHNHMAIFQEDFINDNAFEERVQKEINK